MTYIVQPLQISDCEDPSDTDFRYEPFFEQLQATAMAYVRLHPGATQGEILLAIGRENHRYLGDVLETPLLIKSWTIKPQRYFVRDERIVRRMWNGWQVPADCV